MKKTAIILAIISIFFILAPAAFSYVTFVANCDTTGAVTIYSTQNIRGRVFATKDRSTWFEVPGQWTDDLKFFHSEEMVLKDNFNYRLRVEAPGTFITDVYCPGYKFSCKALEVSIDRCYQRDNLFYAEFTAENHIGIHDLKYIFETEKRTFSRSPIIKDRAAENITIGLLEENSYQLVLDTSLEITNFAVTHEQCSKPQDRYFTYAESICNLTTCLQNSHCTQEEYCDTSKFLCLPLNCDVCEKIHNHSCIPKCDDSNPCTENICREGECTFRQRPGCRFGSQCLSLGEVREIEGDLKFCSISNNWEPQKPDGKYCEDDYECLGMCFENICSERVPRQSIIQAITSFFQSIISFFR